MKKYSTPERSLDDKFNESGFVILRNFLDSDILGYLEKIANVSSRPSGTNYGAGFSKIKYDLGNDDERIFELIATKKFSNTLGNLTGKSLLYTQGLAFGLEKNKSTGFPWHVGTQSFGFQRKEDFGCTLWFPFCEINPQKQRGGMALVPKKYISGEFVYQHIDLPPRYLKEKSATSVVNFSVFDRVKNGLINSPDMDEILSCFSEEDSFMPGDAVLFDKYVIHRSIKLEEGPINNRLAFALRFADVNSRYDSVRANNLEYPKHAFNYAGSSDFNILVCHEDNQLIVDSPLYKDHLDKRLIHVS